MIQFIGAFGVILSLEIMAITAAVRWWESR